MKLSGLRDKKYLRINFKRILALRTIRRGNMKIKFKRRMNIHTKITNSITGSYDMVPKVIKQHEDQNSQLVVIRPQFIILFRLQFTIFRAQQAITPMWL